MPEKLYTASNMGGGLQVVNSLDPVNPQDLATKNYVDGYRNQFGPYVPLWEVNNTQQCYGNANATNGYTHLVYGPWDTTITKLYPDTAIRVIATMTFYINTVSARVSLICGINSVAGINLCSLWPGTVSEHTAFPVGIRYYFASNYLGSATGSMTVAFYMYVSNATTTVITDTNDFASWTIAECKVS